MGVAEIFGGYAVAVSASVSVLAACDDEKGTVPSRTAWHNATAPERHHPMGLAQ